MYLCGKKTIHHIETQEHRFTKKQKKLCTYVVKKPIYHIET